MIARLMGRRYVGRHRTAPLPPAVLYAVGCAAVEYRTPLDESYVW